MSNAVGIFGGRKTRNGSRQCIIDTVDVYVQRPSGTTAGWQRVGLPTQRWISGAFTSRPIRDVRWCSWTKHLSLMARVFSDRTLKNVSPFLRCLCQGNQTTTLCVYNNYIMHSSIIITRALVIRELCAPLTAVGGAA